MHELHGGVGVDEGDSDQHAPISPIDEATQRSKQRRPIDELSLATIKPSDRDVGGHGDGSGQVLELEIGEQSEEPRQRDERDRNSKQLVDTQTPRNNTLYECKNVH